MILEPPSILSPKQPNNNNNNNNDSNEVTITILFKLQKRWI